MTSSSCLLQLNATAESKMINCPFLLLSEGSCTTAVSSTGCATPFEYDDHPLVCALTHQEDSWIMINTNASVMTYVMQQSVFKFSTSDVVLSSTMFMPCRMARRDVEHFARCRTPHITKQLADCRVVLNGPKECSIYSAQTLALLKTFPHRSNY